MPVEKTKVKMKYSDLRTYVSCLYGAENHWYGVMP